MTDIERIMTIFGQCYNLLNNNLGYYINSDRMPIFKVAMKKRRKKRRQNTELQVVAKRMDYLPYYQGCTEIAFH